jgi:hypothetical protein
MSQPAWETIGIVQGGIIPVLYQQVKCSRSGGVRFNIAGSNYFLLVSIQNLGGSGSVAAASVKGKVFSTGIFKISVVTDKREYRIYRKFIGDTKKLSDKIYKK